MPFRFRKTPVTSLITSNLLLTALLFSGPALAQEPENTLSLADAINLALRQNRDVHLAQLSVAASKEKKAEAASAYFPRIRNESGVLHVTELAGIEIPAGAFGGSPSTTLIPAKNLFIGQGSSTGYTSGTGLTQPFTQLYKIRNANKAAEADVKSSQIELGEAENAIAFKVRQLYFSILIAREQRDAAQFEMDADDEKLAETREGIAQGKALDVAGLETQAAALAAKHTKLGQELLLRNLSLELNDILGLPLESHLQLENPAASATLILPSREEALQRILTASPRVKAAEQALLKAKAGNAVARDAYIPDVTGIARYSYQSGIPFLVHNFGTFGFNLSYDLFDGGKRKAELDESRIHVRQSEVNLTKVKEETTIQLQVAYNKLEELESLAAVAKQSLETRNELARVISEQFKQETVLASTRDDAIAKAHHAQAALLEATLGCSIAQADVLRILGESPR